MADLTCDRCQAPLSPGQPRCACGHPVPRGRRRHRQPTQQPRPEDRLPPAGDGSAPPSGTEHQDAVTGSRDPGEQASPTSGRPPDAPCTHQHLPPGLQLCDCGAFLGNAQPEKRPAGVVVLELPWGEHRLGVGELVEIGREVGPFQHQLSDHLKVSRRHASLRLTAGGVLLLQDHASMNHTFLNGTKCPPTGETEVGDGSEIGCSSMLRFLVRFE